MTRPHHRGIVATLGLALVSCTGGNQVVKPDEMSADRHHAEAVQEGRSARNEVKAYRMGDAQPRPFSDAAGGDYLYSVPIYNPTDGHLAAAEKHREHARQHERAARFLEQYEEQECRDFPPASRAACPLLGPAARIDDVEGGVRVRLKDGSRVDAVVAHMRCHYAFARARAFAEATSCPLYMRGIEIKKGVDPMTVEITTQDRRQVAEVRRRSREETVLAPTAATEE